MINEKDKIENVDIQPSKALELAQPLLNQHGTYNWDENKELKTFIVLKGKWYYIMQTNYPAKSINYYLQPAVMVHTKSGEIKFSTKSPE
jgi:hypothetical protein